MMDKDERTKSAVVAWVFTSRTCSVELHSAYPTYVVLGHVPAPGSYSVPLLDNDLHLASWCSSELRTV